MSEAGRSNPFRPAPVAGPADQEIDFLTLDDDLLGPAGQATGPVLPPGSPRRGSEGVVLRASGRLAPSEVAVVGLHGGAGATTAQQVLTRYSSDPGISWVPGPAVGAVPEQGGLVLVARTSGVGLHRAAEAARQWGAGELPNVALLGLILVADGPKIAVPLSPALKRITRMYPRTWRLEWVPEWHLSSEPSLDRVPRRVAGVAKKVTKWAANRGLQPHPNTKE